MRKKGLWRNDRNDTSSSGGVETIRLLKVCMLTALFCCEAFVCSPESGKALFYKKKLFCSAARCINHSAQPKQALQFFFYIN